MMKPHHLACLTLCLASHYAHATPALPKGATLIQAIDNNNYAFTLNHMTVVKVSGKNFTELGNHYGKLLKQPLQQRFKLEETSTQIKPSGQIASLILNTYIHNNDLTKHETQFLKGAATSSELSFHQLLYMNLSFLFSVTDRPKAFQPTLCSFIAKQTDNATTLVGRNLEWTTKFHGPNGQGAPVITVMQLQNGKPHNQIASIGYLGWFDAATIINDKGLFAEVNSGEGSSHAMNAKNSPNLTSHFIDYLLNDNTLNQLKQDILKSDTNLAYIANIAGPTTDSKQSFSYSIEKAITASGNFNTPKHTTTSMARTPTTQTHYDLPINTDLLIATNTFRIKGWEPFLKDAYLSETPYPELENDGARKSFHRYNNLIQLATNAATWNSDPDGTMKDIMATPLHKDGSGGSTFMGMDPSDTLYTYYSVAFNTRTKMLYINDPVSKNGWTTLDANLLFKK